MNQNRALPGWCQILDELLSEGEDTEEQAKMRGEK